MVLTPEEMLSLFCEREDLETKCVCVAENEDLGSEIYLTDEGGFPSFIVDVDGEQICVRNSVTVSDAKFVYEELLSEYIEVDSEDDSPFSDEEIDRIDDVFRAADDFLHTLLEKDPFRVLTEDQVNQFINDICCYLWDEHKLKVWYPSEIDGVVIDYPHEAEILK